MEVSEDTNDAYTIRECEDRVCSANCDRRLAIGTLNRDGDRDL